MKIIIDGAEKLAQEEIEMLDAFTRTPLWKSLEKLAGNTVNLMAHQMITEKDREEVIRLQAGIKSLQGFFHATPLILHQSVAQKPKRDSAQQPMPEPEKKKVSSRRSPPPTATIPT